MVQHEIAFQLDRLRRRKHLSQFELAAQIGTSTQTISLFGKGILPGRMALVEEYARAVGADIVYVRQALIASLPALRAGRHRLVQELEALLSERRPTTSFVDAEANAVI
jgi:transcriptional regulator with XRE-family HTH domain